MCGLQGRMYSSIQDRERLEDDLYQEDERDSEVSEINSELEFHLYSQLHYSSNALELEDENVLEDQQLLEKTRDGDRKPEYLKDGKPPSPDDHSYQQHLKKKKAVKPKKRQTDPKGQKLSSSALEEVIVIDSSPVVISISESDSSNDDGICAMKTSTPAQQEIQKRKSSLGVLVTVISSSSDTSESESDTDSSESDGSDDLENWMILGQGMQDGDQSISLNLEAGSDYSTEDEEEEGGSWLVSDKDKEALIYNKDRGHRFLVQVSNRYYTGKNVNCSNCNKTGHLSKNCHEPKKLLPCFLCGITSHQSRDCPNKHCNNCGQPGHLFKSCSEMAYWHKHCSRCNMKGHFLDACPEIWRQYHMTTKSGLPVKQQARNKGHSAYCYNCSMKGHFGFACGSKRMYNGVCPSSSLINHYDTAVDVKRRRGRMNRKADEMRETGCLPDPLSTFLTPKPPKKKQKISLNMKNHRPHQTQNQFRPSPNHIIFTDDGFGNITPKTKKFNQQQSVSSFKPWKPKRPVPTSRDVVPSRKLALDEAEDFPRGGGLQQKDKDTKNKRNKRKQVSLFRIKGQNDNGLDSERERTLGLASKNQKGKKKKNKKTYAQKSANKKSGAQHPEDDDLFIIKQRKRRR